MQSRLITRLPALVLAGALLVTACSDDDGGDGDDGDTGAQGFIDARAESLATQDGGELFVFTEEEAQCLAEAEVEALGVDFLVDNGITADELAAADSFGDLGLTLTEEQARGAAEGYATCDLGFGRLFTGELGTETQIACIDEAVDPAVLVDAAIARYLGDEAAAGGIQAPVTAAIEACRAAG